MKRIITKKIIEIYQALKNMFVVKKSHNEIVIEEIYDGLHKIMALEEYYKKYGNEEEASKLYIHNLQRVRNEIILSLNKIYVPDVSFDLDTFNDCSTTL